MSAYEGPRTVRLHPPRRTLRRRAHRGRPLLASNPTLHSPAGLSQPPRSVVVDTVCWDAVADATGYSGWLVGLNSPQALMDEHRVHDTDETNIVSWGASRTKMGTFHAKALADAPCAFTRVSPRARESLPRHRLACSLPPTDPLWSWSAVMWGVVTQLPK
jgi:hypothetical protein